MKVKKWADRELYGDRSVRFLRVNVSRTNLDQHLASPGCLRHLLIDLDRYANCLRVQQYNKFIKRWKP